MIEDISLGDDGILTIWVSEDLFQQVAHQRDLSSMVIRTVNAHFGGQPFEYVGWGTSESIPGGTRYCYDFRPV